MPYRTFPIVRSWNPNLTICRTSRGKFDAALPTARDAVDCAVFAPQRLGIGEQVLIQVFVHTPDDAETLWGLAEAADPETMHRGTTMLSTEIARGARLMFALNIPHLLIDEPIQEIIWRGEMISVQFSIMAPKNLTAALVEARRPLSTVATISVSQDGVIIGQLKFVLQIERTAIVLDNLQLTGEATRYQTAFISYASQNRPEVLRRVQMLRLVGISYFQDLLSLDPGQRWAQQLYHHIDTSDVFFLFWSTPAKQSKWVTREWRYGLKQKGLDFIKPVMIEGPPPVPPPKALAKLHFNDWLLYVIRAEEAARGSSTLAK
jgi:TIR domain